MDIKIVLKIKGSLKPFEFDTKTEMVLNSLPDEKQVREMMDILNANEAEMMITFKRAPTEI